MLSCFLSVTNGDAGHLEQGGEVLAQRRRAEAQEAARRLGITYKVLDFHDGELVPSLEARQALIREIRTWSADVVVSHRPNDYHPDHRYTGVLVQDAAILVEVPNILPSVELLDHNPVFLYFQDDFQKPNPFTPDITIVVDDTYDKKIRALDAHVSQFHEYARHEWRYGRDAGRRGRAFGVAKAPLDLPHQSSYACFPGAVVWSSAGRSGAIR